MRPAQLRGEGAAGPGLAERGLRRGSQFKKLRALRHGGVRAARAPVTLSAVNSLFLGGGAEGFLSGRRPARGPCPDGCSHACWHSRVSG